MPSRLLLLALLAVLAVLAVQASGDDSDPDLGEEVYFAGPNGYAHSSVMPGHLSVLMFMKTSKEECKIQCDREEKCQGFKYGGGGCSLMGGEKPLPPPKSLPNEVPMQQTEDMTTIAGKKIPFVSSKQRAKADVYLASVAGKESDSDLKSIMEDAKEEQEEIQKEGLSPRPRNPAHVQKRGVEMLKKMQRFEMQYNFYEEAKKELPRTAERKIKKKVKLLPGDTRAGSQQGIANEIIRKEWKHFKNAFNREKWRTKKKKLTDYGSDIDLEVRKMIENQGADLTMVTINQKEQASEKKWKTLKFWRLTPESLGGQGLVSSSESLYADSLPNCKELKPMCKLDIRTRRQCPHTCKFVKELNHKEEEKALAAKDVLIKRREDTAQDMKQQRLKAEKRLEIINKEDAEQKEREVKLKEKESELESKVEHPAEKTVIKVTPDPAIEVAQKRDAKARGLRKLAMELQNQGERKVTQGQAFMQSANADVRKQRNATKNAEITSNITEIKNGKAVNVEPDVEGNLEKASEEAPLIANNLESAIKLIKSGQDDLKRSKTLLQNAVAVSEDKPVPQPAKKPMGLVPTTNGIPINPKRIAALRGELSALVQKMKAAPQPDRPPMAAEIEEIKKKLLQQYKPLPPTIAEPNDFENMSGNGRKAVEDGPKTSGENYDPDEAKLKELESAGKKALLGRNSEDKEKLERARQAVNTAATAGKSRGHSTWSPKPRRKRKGGRRGRGRRGRGRRKRRKPKAEVGTKYGVFASAESRATVAKLGDAIGQLHHKLTLSERHTSFDHDGGCDYNPPPGCGCSGSTMIQQSEPNNKLQEATEEAQLGTEDADPVSKGDCPAMPAGCACRSQTVAALSLVQEIEVDDNAQSNDSSEDSSTGDNDNSLEGALDSMFVGIICRVRAAMSVAQKTKPGLLNLLEKKAAFVKHKTQLKPLLSCVQDAAQSDSTCGQYLPALMDSMGEVEPMIEDMQQKLGAPYQKAAKQCRGA